MTSNFVLPRYITYITKGFKDGRVIFRGGGPCRRWRLRESWGECATPPGIRTPTALLYASRIFGGFQRTLAWQADIEKLPRAAAKLLLSPYAVQQPRSNLGPLTLKAACTQLFLLASVLALFPWRSSPALLWPFGGIGSSTMAQVVVTHGYLEAAAAPRNELPLEADVPQCPIRQLLLAIYDCNIYLIAG